MQIKTGYVEVDVEKATEAAKACIRKIFKRRMEILREEAKNYVDVKFMWWKTGERTWREAVREAWNAGDEWGWYSSGKSYAWGTLVDMRKLIEACKVSKTGTVIVTTEVAEVLSRFWGE